MTQVVLDNSVVCGWPLEDQAAAYTDAVADLLRTGLATAPPLLRLAYTNVLRTACKRQKIFAARAYEMLKALAALPIDIDLAIPDPARILDLALQHDLTSYDAM